MTYIAGLIVVGTLCLLNITMTVGVIRRLREHEAMMRSPETPSISAATGAEVGDFATASTTGEPITKADTLQETNFLFVSSDCQPCRDRLAGYIEHIKAAETRTVAVLMPADDDIHFAEMRDALGAVADVVVEPYGDPIWQAFSVVGTPAFVTVRDGKITATDVQTLAGTAVK